MIVIIQSSKCSSCFYSLSFSHFDTHSNLINMPPNMQKRILNEIEDVNGDNTAPLHVYVPDDGNICRHCSLYSI